MLNTRNIALLISGLFITVISCSNVLAQRSNNFNVGINAGPSLALGQLGSQQYNTGGYALSGSSIAAEGIWYFHPALGIGVAVSQTKFPFADGAYAHDMVNGDPAMESLYLKSDAYQVWTYTAGLFYRHHIFRKFSATGHLAGGVLWAQTPDHLFVANFFMVPNIGYKITPSQSTKATYQAGLALQYQLFDHIGLSLKADYFLANSAFRFYTATDSYIKNITFSYLNTMIGIDFKF